MLGVVGSRTWDVFTRREAWVRVFTIDSEGGVVGLDQFFFNIKIALKKIGIGNHSQTIITWTWIGFVQLRKFKVFLIANEFMAGSIWLMSAQFRTVISWSRHFVGFLAHKIISLRNRKTMMEDRTFYLYRRRQNLHFQTI